MTLPLNHSSRRRFLAHLAAGFTAYPMVRWAAPAKGFEIPFEGSPDRILILLQLDGGNDGLNTLIPYGNASYHRIRKALRIPQSALPSEQRINGFLAWHPHLKNLSRLFQEGQVAAVQGVGYPEPNRSHFKSLDIWDAASPKGRGVGSGWLGRLMDIGFRSDLDQPNLLIHIGETPPYALKGHRHSPVAFRAPKTFRWKEEELELKARDRAIRCEHQREEDETSPYVGRDAALEQIRRVHLAAQQASEEIRSKSSGYIPKVTYPKRQLAGSLATMASLIDGDLFTRVYSTRLSGFDTHIHQKPKHDRLMTELDLSLEAFLKDLRAHHHQSRVVILAYSEFGRRVRENGSGGTDHGVAGPVFLIGDKVRGGVFGNHPSLDQLDEGDLKASIDFRSIYASIIDQWFGVDHRLVLGRSFPTLDLFES